MEDGCRFGEGENVGQEATSCLTAVSEASDCRATSNVLPATKASATFQLTQNNAEETKNKPLTV